MVYWFVKMFHVAQAYNVLSCVGRPGYSDEELCWCDCPSARSYCLLLRVQSHHVTYVVSPCYLCSHTMLLMQSHHLTYAVTPCCLCNHSMLLIQSHHVSYAVTPCSYSVTPCYLCSHIILLMLSHHVTYAVTPCYLFSHTMLLMLSLDSLPAILLMLIISVTMSIKWGARVQSQQQSFASNGVASPHHNKALWLYHARVGLLLF